MSDTLRAAAQQALEELEYHVEQTRPIHKTSEAITALRAALAQPDVPESGFGNMAAAVAEPVASVTECEACFTPDVCQLRGTCDHYAAERLRVAAPPQREPYDQTALGLCNACGWKAVGPDGCLNCVPKREPLTDEQIDAACAGIECSNIDLGVYDRLIARAVERAHGIAPASAPKEKA